MAKAKTGLGKGIDLLIPHDEDIVSSANEESKTTLKLSQVEPNRKQPRKKFDKESLEELAESIRQYGIIQPIVVCKRDDYYEIIAGERRWRAAKKAGLKEVPVVIKEYTDKEIAEISLIENIQREDLNPVEEANAYKKLIEEYGLTQEELAQRISKSRAAVTNTLRLLKLHSEIQNMLVNGEITAGHARALLGIEDQNIQLELAEKITGGSLSVRQTEDLVRLYNNPPAVRKKPIKNDASYTELEKRMTESLHTKVRILQKDKGKGKVEISYYSEDQLDEIFRTINKGSL